jgi:SAM-dependent methyltransferase
VPSRRLALDVGCGNGQFTRRLAEAFDSVIGLDPSAEQIAHAAPHPRVTYGVAPAERLGAGIGGVDLITAAQAAHWFDLPRFYAEARRVAAPGAMLALISYGVMRFDADLEARFQQFYTADIGPYWPPERRLVDEGYRGITFPFREVAPPRIDIVREWNFAALLGYISTWSAVRNAREADKDLVLERFSQEFLALWGDPESTRTIRWPIAMRAGMLD